MNIGTVYRAMIKTAGPSRAEREANRRYAQQAQRPAPKPQPSAPQQKPASAQPTTSLFLNPDGSFRPMDPSRVRGEATPTISAPREPWPSRQPAPPTRETPSMDQLRALGPERLKSASRPAAPQAAAKPAPAPDQRQQEIARRRAEAAQALDRLKKGEVAVTPDAVKGAAIDVPASVANPAAPKASAAAASTEPAKPNAPAASAPAKPAGTPAKPDTPKANKDAPGKPWPEGSGGMAFWKQSFPGRPVPQPPQPQTSANTTAQNSAAKKDDKGFQLMPWLKDNWHMIAVPALGLLGGMALGGKENRGLGALAGLGLGLGANYFFGDDIRNWGNSLWASNKPVNSQQTQTAQASPRKLQPTTGFGSSSVVG